jgi:tetratricopeptide (TPR) repeat protein
VRCYYQLKDYTQANDAAKNLLTRKGISTDDKSIALLVLGKSQQVKNDCAAAIASFKSCAAINKAAWGAEARYEIAVCQFAMNNLTASEKSALAVIKETGSYDNWVTKSYILLGDIFMQQKDYFNAKATYESVAKNAAIPELKAEAQQKLDRAIEEEKAVSKVGG